MSDGGADRSADDDPVGDPTDVDAALADLIGCARERQRAGETDALVEHLDTIAAVAGNELPPGDRRDRLVHGCERVADLAGDDPPVAAEYLRLMESIAE